MRHHDTIKKFGRVRKQRRALMAGLARSLVLSRRIKTTEAKAKSLRPYIEKLVSKARGGTLASRRLISARLDNSPEAARILIEDIAPKYKDRPGGYTRIVKLPTRDKDAASMAVIEFV